VYSTPWDAEKQLGCVCDLGQRGPDCSLFECPSGGDVLKGKYPLLKAMVPSPVLINIGRFRCLAYTVISPAVTAQNVDYATTL